MSTLADFISAEVHNESLRRPHATYVLVIEPDNQSRQQIYATLNPRFKVLFALNGKHAMDILQKYSVEMVISEQNLPVMNGREVLSAIKQNLEFAKIPFAVLTGEASQNTKVEFLESGADDYLAKPFSPPELIARVSNLTKLRRYQVQIEEGLKAARVIQHALMPPPQLQFLGARFEYLYYPCDKLSGDFLDVIQTERMIYIYAADVTSHGTAAAQITYLIKGMFREAVAAAKGHNKTLSDIANRVGNNYASLGLSYSIGLRAMAFNPVSRELTVAGSNAPEAVIFSDGQRVSYSNPPGPVLDTAFWVDKPFPMTTLQLKPGDFVYIYTDGYEEMLHKIKSNGRRALRMKDLETILQTGPADKWRTVLIDQLIKANEGPKFPDDMTIGRLQID